MVDTTWGSAGLVTYVRDWKVLVDAKFLSDHRYVSYGVSMREVGERAQGCVALVGPHWNRTDFKEDLYVETLRMLFAGIDLNNYNDVNAMARTLRDRMTSACDATGKRTKRSHNRRCSWWIRHTRSVYALDDAISD